MSIQKDPTADVQIRWLIRRDMPEVLEIENRSFARPWTEEDFVCNLKERNCIGSVAESKQADGRIYGYMVYTLDGAHLHLLNVAVAPEVRRTGIGSALIERLIGKLSEQRRHRIITAVRESNLTAQMFLSRVGFKGSPTKLTFADGESVIQFVYTLPSATLANGFYRGVNRIGGYYE